MLTATTDLHDALTATASAWQPWTWVAVTVAVLGALIALGSVVALMLDVPEAFLVLVIGVFLAAGGPAWVRDSQANATDEARVQAAARYVHDTYDLVPIRPPLVEDHSITLDAVASDGQEFTVTVTWKDDLEPVLDDTVVPSAAELVHVAIEPVPDAGGGDDR